MPNILRLIAPEELGEPSSGDDWDPDLHGPKYRVITEEMQEEERVAEKKRNGQFVDEPVQDAQQRLLSLIPKNNLRIPYKWFDNDTDAEKFFKAVARGSNFRVDRLGKTTTANTICVFLDVVLKHRDLRTKKEGDPQRMSLQERRNRHWQAVIEESFLAKDLSLRLVRHVTLMLVGASLDFDQSNGKRNNSSDLNGKIDKLSVWYGENDPSDVESFEYFQPERQKLHDHEARGRSQSRQRGWANGVEKRKSNNRKRKRKADTYRPSSNVRKKQRIEQQRVEPRPPLSPPRPNDRIELPERLAEAKGGRRNWDALRRS